jgi:hypothetical protein
MIRIAEIRVLATHLRPQRRQLRIHKCPDQGEETAGDPGREDERGRMHGARYHRGIDEYSRSDDPAHHDHDGVEKAEALRQ